MGTRGRRSDDGLSDALPNSMIGLGNYRDTGCSLHPKCLTCPFAKCRYELAAAVYAPRRVSMRDEAIRRAWDAGESVASIAKRFTMSRRTVYRALDRVVGERASVSGEAEHDVVGIAGGQAGA